MEFGELKDVTLRAELNLSPYLAQGTVGVWVRGKRGEPTEAAILSACRGRESDARYSYCVKRPHIVGRSPRPPSQVPCPVPPLASKHERR